MDAWINKCHFGDVRAVLRRMIADGVKVNTIVTSPPYWGLRSYLPADHPDKALEIGSEPTIGEFLGTMVDVFDLCRQVLRDDGTMWVNMGDSYAGDAARAPGAMVASQRRDNAPVPRSDRRVEGFKPKDLMGQPWRLAFALQDAGWWLRQDIVWHKPNPMPESAKDRCTKAHEFIFLLAKSERYYYDFEAIKEPVSGTAHARRAEVDVPSGWTTGTDRKHDEVLGRYSQYRGNGVGFGHGYDEKPKRRTTGRKLAEPGSGTKLNTSYDAAIGSGGLVDTRNKRSVWTVPSAPYKGAHFATFPPKLIEPCVLAGCPVGGTVLDIFFGSGTTGQVAQALGRHFIGIDIDRRNDALQADRLRQPSLSLETQS
jgi:DNA modification methylase